MRELKKEIFEINPFKNLCIGDIQLLAKEEDNKERLEHTFVSEIKGNNAAAKIEQFEVGTRVLNRVFLYVNEDKNVILKQIEENRVNEDEVLEAKMLWADSVIATIVVDEKNLLFSVSPDKYYGRAYKLQNGCVAVFDIDDELVPLDQTVAMVRYLTSSYA